MLQKESQMSGPYGVCCKRRARCQAPQVYVAKGEPDVRLHRCMSRFSAGHLLCCWEFSFCTFLISTDSLFHSRRNQRHSLRVGTFSSSFKTVDVRCLGPISQQSIAPQSLITPKPNSKHCSKLASKHTHKRRSSSHCRNWFRLRS